MSETSLKRLYLMRVAYLPPTLRPVVTYLIQTDDGKNILVDTGLIDNPQFPVEMKPVFEQNVIAQLAQIGLTPENIDILVTTHFDVDHAGHHGAFTGAEWVLQRRLYDTGLNNPRYAQTRPQWDKPDVRWHFIDGDTTLVPGLELIATDGHATGHLSVLLRLPQTGTILLTIDAVPERDNFNMQRQPGRMDENPAELLASTQKLLDIVEREKPALVIHGHDGKQWNEELRRLPEFYE